MKKRDKKKMVYDAMALRLAVALEAFVNAQMKKHCRNLPGGVNKMKYKAKINSLVRDARFKEGGAIAELMGKIFDKRHEVAHPHALNYHPKFGESDFRVFREECSELDKLLHKEKKTEESPMSQMMFHSLPYDMGNAGDLIKHGALVECVRWWFAHNKIGKAPIRFADPFGGCPWEVAEKPVSNRLNQLRRKAGGSFIADRLYDVDKCRYYNSGHIVTRTADALGKSAKVWTSDKSDIARSDLKASGLSLLDDKYPGVYKNNDGYSVLEHDSDFDLILLDPFANLLTRKLDQFKIIRDIINKNPKVVVMVFVLDLHSLGEESREGVKKTHDRYMRERKKFGDAVLSLRCPKIPGKDEKQKESIDGIAGESEYEMEILLISKMFANGGGDDLRARLENFASAVQGTLPLAGGRVKVLP